MKRRKDAPPAPSQTSKQRLMASVKVLILLAIAVQTFLPDFLPIMSDPAGLRVAGVVLYSLGLLTAITARVQLGQNWSDIEKARLVDGHRLVARGLYCYIRHPIYTGDLLLLAGFELALNSWLVAGAVLLAVYVRKQAIGEERNLIASLPGYAQYCRETSRFLPFLL